MIGFNGGLIGQIRDTSSSFSAPGLWTPNEQVIARKRSLWPNPSDPFLSNVLLLVKADGPNNSTIFIDSSSYKRTLTAGGTPLISTTRSKYGGSSLFLNGSSYLSTPNVSFDFGIQDFTIEAWVNIEVIGIGQILTTYLGANSGLAFGHRSDFGPGFVFGVGNTVLISRPYSTTQEWIHVAVSRTGTDLRMFFDGVQQGATVTNSTNITSTASTIRIGALVSPNFFGFNGYIDDLRVTNISRYQSNFTPPTEGLTAA